jgi:hypothetical protein
VNHACRDDYGTGSAMVSAWAGIHYFACRDGEAQNASQRHRAHRAGRQRLAGNGMLRSIGTRAGSRLLTGALAFRVAGGERAAKASRSRSTSGCRRSSERCACSPSS